MSTQLDIRSLVSANMAASNEKTRYYLNGVYTHIKDNKRVYVATDGQILVKIERDIKYGDNREAIIIPSGIIERFGKCCAKELKSSRFDSSNAVLEKLSDTEYQLSIGGFSQTFPIIDGTFPDYNRVIPTGEGSVSRIGFNPELISTLGKSQKAYKCTKTAALAFDFIDSTSSVRICKNEEWQAVIMPMRV